MHRKKRENLNEVVKASKTCPENFLIYFWLILLFLIRRLWAMKRILRAMKRIIHGHIFMYNTTKCPFIIPGYFCRCPNMAIFGHFFSRKSVQKCPCTDTNMPKPVVGNWGQQLQDDQRELESAKKTGMNCFYVRSWSLGNQNLARKKWKFMIFERALYYGAHCRNLKITRK